MHRGCLRLAVGCWTHPCGFMHVVHYGTAQVEMLADEPWAGQRKLKMRMLAATRTCDVLVFVLLPWHWKCRCQSLRSVPMVAWARFSISNLWILQGAEALTLLDGRRTQDRDLSRQFCLLHMRVQMMESLVNRSMTDSRTCT